MSFLEFVGFVVTMLAMAYLMIRQVREAGQEPQEEKEIPPEQKKQMNELLRALNIEVKEEEKPVKVEVKKKKPLPPPPSTVARYVEKHISQPLTDLTSRGAGSDDSYAISSNFETLSLPSVIPLESDPIPRTSHVKALLSDLPSRKELLIFHDVFGPAKGL